MITMTKGAVFMKKRILILLLTTSLLIGILTLLPVHSESLIYDKVLRLHVIANSDSEEDQSLKLLVRDALLEKTNILLSNVKSRDEAKTLIEENLAELQKIAKSTVKENGDSYSVSIEFSEEKYPTKTYDNVAFPAGEYLSLRIKIGSAEGKNWWCVLFPPMCLSAATDKEAFTSVGITDSQYQIITDTDKPKYKVKFKILESLSEFVN